MHYFLMQNTNRRWIISFPSLKLNLFSYSSCLLLSHLKKIAYTSKKKVQFLQSIYICICKVLTIGKQCSGSFCFIYVIYISCYYNSKFGKKLPTNKQRRNVLASPNNTKQKIPPPYSLLCKMPDKISTSSDQMSPSKCLYINWAAWLRAAGVEFPIFTEV